MLRSALLLFLFVPFVPLFETTAQAQDPGDVALDFRSDPAFGDPTIPLREFLRDRHVHSRRAQHFCAVGYQSPGGEDKRAWIHWTEGGKIILWRGASDPESAKTAISRSRVSKDLKKDVVPTEADIKGSTYLVTRAWVNHLLSDCRARGAKYEIRLK